MNWYKTSKMIDFTPNTVAKKLLVCPKCRKWGTSSTGNLYAIQCKTYAEIDPEEQREIDEAKILFEQGLLTYESESCGECRKQNELV